MYAIQDLPSPSRAERESAKILLDDLRSKALNCLSLLLALGARIELLSAKRVTSRQINAAIVTVGIHAPVVAGLVVCWLLGAYIVDNTMLRASGEHLMQQVGFSEAGAYFGVYVLAWALLAVDVAAGHWWVVRLSSPMNPAVKLGVLIAGLCWPLAIALFTHSAFEARQAADGVAVAGFESQKVAATMVAFITHGSLFAGANTIVRGLRNAAWLFTDWRVEQKLLALREEYHVGAARYEALRIRFREAAHDFNRAFPQDPVSVEELDDARRQLTENEPPDPRSHDGKDD